MWTKLGQWDIKQFESSFVELTHKNFTALKQNWTRETENALRAAVPGRWQDVQAVLQQAKCADQPVRPLTTAASARVIDDGARR